MGTGLIAGILAALGSGSAMTGMCVAGISVGIGAVAGVFFDRAAHARDPAVLPMAFGLVGGLAGASTLAALPSTIAFVSHLLPATTFWALVLGLAAGGVGGTLLGASVGVLAGRQDPEDPLPAAGRSAVVAGLGAFGFAHCLVALGMGVESAGPLGGALLQLAYAVECLGPGTLGILAGLAAASGTLLAAGRRAWAERDAPRGPIVAGRLLHASSEVHRAMMAGEDPTIH